MDEDSDQSKDMFRVLAESGHNNDSQYREQVIDSHAWRNVQMSDHEDSSDTEDEDDPDETRKFLSMMKVKQKRNLVNIRWVDGKVVVTPVTEEEHDCNPYVDSLTVTKVDADYQQGQRLSEPRQSLPDTVTITRIAAASPSAVAAGDPAVVKQMEYARSAVKERRRELAAETKESVKGKRKFEDRMSLTEAKLTDFEDSRDYVDFLQSKLQGINIKVVK